MIRTPAVLLLGVAVSVSLAAAAQAQPAAQVGRQFKPALVGLTVRSTLPTAAQSELMQAIDLSRFEQVAGAADEEPLQAWCRNAVMAMQLERGERDETGSGVMTSDAVEERCSQAYRSSLEIAHTCHLRQGLSGVSRVRCEIRLVLDIHKLRAIVVNQQVRFAIDATHGQQGQSRVEASHEGEERVVGGVTESVAETRALRQAIAGVGRQLKEALAQSASFANFAALRVLKGGRAVFCMDRGQLRLDMPFVAVRVTKSGAREVSYVRVRRLGAGCVAPSEGGASGESEVQVLDGTPQLVSGLSLREAPWRGLELGLRAGTWTDTGLQGLHVGLQAAYSLADSTAVSELYGVVQMHLLSVGAAASPQPLLLGIDGGVLKRWYARYGLFADLAAYATASGRLDANDEPQLATYGVAAEGGIGWLAGRSTLLRLGLRAPLAWRESGEQVSVDLRPSGHLGFIWSL
jgi:hypothetical protein